MTRNRNRKDEAKRSDYRAAILLATIPFTIAAGPVVGWFLGRWVDRKAGTDWIFQVIGVGLGVTAAAREVIRLLRRVERDTDKD